MHFAPRSRAQQKIIDSYRPRVPAVAAPVIPKRLRRGHGERVRSYGLVAAPVIPKRLRRF